MASFQRKTVYFKVAGEQNSAALIKIVEEYVKNEGINNIIVASSSGETGVKVAKTFR